MELERFFYGIVEKNMEKPDKDDKKLLGSVGISECPFFKFTGGGNTLVVYGYERGPNRCVVRFRSPEHAIYNEELAGSLRGKGFKVAKLLKKEDVSGRKLAYRKAGRTYEIKYFDEAEWVGYDFGIKAKAAVCMLEKCGYDLECRYGKAAMDMLKRIGVLSGNFFGSMHKRGILYLDFSAHNLAGEKEVCLFDFHGDFLARTRDADRYLTTAWFFFKYMDWYPEKDADKEKVLSVLRGGFVEGVGSSGADKSLIMGVRDNVARWG